MFFDRPSISLRNIAISALLIVAMSPSKALGPSFQMSYAATLALVAGYALWAQRPMRESAFLKLPVMKPLLVAGRFFGGILLTSMIGGFSTALFSIEHFHRLTAYGLPANLMAMPFISFIIMPMGMIAMLLTPFGLDVIFWKAAGIGVDIVIAIAKMVAGWGGNIGIGRLPSWYFPAAVAGFLILTLLRTRIRHVGMAVMAISTFLVTMRPADSPPNIVISEDGSLVAIVHGTALASNREHPPDFIFDQWQRALVLTEHQPPNIIDGVDVPQAERGGGKRLVLSPEQQRDARREMRGAVGSGSENRFSCIKKAWCTAELDSGYVLTVIENAAYLGPACDTADIVVTAARLRFDTCKSGSILFTGESLRKSGSVEMRINEGTPEITTAFDRLDRPWIRHRAYDWRNGTFTGAAVSPVSDSGE